jgi:hypothetical protein
MNPLVLNAGGFHYPDIPLPPGRSQVAPHALKGGSPYKNQGPLELPCRNWRLTLRKEQPRRNTSKGGIFLLFQNEGPLRLVGEKQCQADHPRLAQRGCHPQRRVARAEAYRAQHNSVGRSHHTVYHCPIVRLGKKLLSVQDRSAGGNYAERSLVRESRRIRHRAVGAQDELRFGFSWERRKRCATQRSWLWQRSCCGRPSFPLLVASSPMEHSLMAPSC